MAINTTLLQSLENGNSPVVLAQLNISQPWSYFVVDSAGIWKFSTLTNVYSGIDSEITENFPTLTVVGIGDVRVDGVSLVEVTSYTNTIDGRATALAVEPSFIFDGANDVLYVRFDEDYNPPIIFTIKIGAIFALADKPYYDYVNNINYSPDLKNTPSLLQRKDEIFFQQLRFDSFTQNINNADRRYDERKDSDVFGSLIEYYIGTKNLAFEFFEKIYTGKVVRDSFNIDTWAITVRDSRKALTNPIPTNYISSTTYPNADSYSSGIPLPLLYGTVTDSRCLSLDINSTGSPTDYRFAFADTNDFNVDASTYEIKVDGKPVTPSVAPSDTTGLFSLATADYTPGQTVSYSGGGIAVTNQLDIVKHLLVNYSGIPYTVNNFNTTEWEAETLKAKDMGIAITEKTTVIEVIQELAASSAAGFLRQPDGLFTWRTFNSASDSILQVKNLDYVDNPRLDRNAEEVLSSATVLYDKSYTRNVWKSQTDDSKASTADITLDRSFTSYYLSSADALAFAQDIMNRSADVRDIIEFSVPVWFLGADIGQNIEIELNHTNGNTWLGFLKCEVLSVIPDIQNNRVRYIVRAFESIDGFSIIHDFNGDSTTTIFDFNGDSTTSIVDYNGG